MRLQGRREERQTPPFPTRQTKAKKASEQRDRLKEVDSQRERGRREERRGVERDGQPKSDKEAGGGEREGGRHTVPEAADG